MAKTSRKKKLETKAAKKSVEEVKVQFCKDCKYYQHPTCTYHDIFVARKNSCDAFAASVKKLSNWEKKKGVKSLCVI